LSIHRSGKRTPHGERVAEAKQLRRIASADLKAVLRGEAGSRERLAPLTNDSFTELLELATALGGLEVLSPQKVALLQDYARLGLMMRALTVKFCETEDPELASRAATLAANRRATLSLLVLERYQRELDLRTYLKEREAGQAAAGATNVAKDEQRARGNS